MTYTSQCGLQYVITARKASKESKSFIFKKNLSTKEGKHATVCAIKELKQNVNVKRISGKRATGLRYVSVFK